MAFEHNLALGLYATRTEEVAPAFRLRLPQGWTLTEVRPATIASHIEYLDYLAIGGAPLDFELIDRAKKLKAVHKLGVGYDDIDVDALNRRNIPLAICETGSAEAVAEHAMGLAFAAAKNLANLDHAVRHLGIWPKWEARRSLSRIGGRTVGIVGFGRIGKAAARLFAALGCKVIVYTRSPGLPTPELSFVSSLEELFSKASLVSVHVPSTPSTEQLITYRLIEMLGPKGILVNTSRGSVIVQNDLFNALHNGKLGFAALDVLETEPPHEPSGLGQVENLIVTPHIGGGGLDTFEAKADFILANLQHFHRGRPLSGVVNLPPSLEKTRVNR